MNIQYQIMMAEIEVIAAKKFEKMLEKRWLLFFSGYYPVFRIFAITPTEYYEKIEAIRNAIRDARLNTANAKIKLRKLRKMQ